MMVSCASFPRKGHLEILCRMFAHLKNCHDTEMAFDPSKPSTNEKEFRRNDRGYSEFISTIKKECELRTITTVSRGTGITIVGKVDAEYAGDTVARRSREG